MPQLNTTIYFHEYGWLFFSFFFFYFIFLKYYLPKLIHWMKVKQSNLVYHLDFLTTIDKKIQLLSTNETVQELYKLLLSTSLLSTLNQVYRRNIGNQLKSSNVERTIFNLLNSYKR